MTRRYSGLIVALTMLVVANVGLTVHQNLVARETAGEVLDGELPEYRTLVNVFTQVQKHYVDESDVDAKKLWRGAINGMLGELDPYSTYLPADRYEEFRESTEGVFGGLGIRIEMVDGWVTVVSPLPNTPAFRAGLKAGDRIYMIEDESTRGITINDAVKQLKGDPGTKVTIRVARQLPDLSVDDLEFTLERDIIDVPAIDENSRLITDTVAYIRLNDFTQDAADELENTILKLEEQGMKALILDLRYNSGGLLPVAIDVCGLFVPRNTVAVKIEHRDPRKNEELRCSRRQVWKGPMVILVNRYSASASEIVAGCLQDLHRATILGPKGENTYGKGSVQTILTLDDGAALKLTTARYLTPNGRNIHEKGIRPDIWVNVSRKEIFALSQDHRWGELPPGYFEDYRKPSSGDVAEATGEVSATDAFAMVEEEGTEDESTVFYDSLVLEAVNQLKTILILSRAE